MTTAYRKATSGRMLFLFMLMGTYTVFGQDAVDRHLARRWGGDDLFTGDRLSSLNFSSDGRWLAWSGDHGGAALFDVERRQVVSTWPKSSDVKQLQFLTEPDELFLYQVAPIRGEVWDVKAHKRIRAVGDMTGRFAISNDRRFMIAENKAAWNVRDLKSGEHVGSLSNIGTRSDLIPTLALSPNGRHFAYWTSSGVLTVWDVQSQKRMWDESAKQNTSVIHIEFSSSGEIMAVARHGCVELWNVETGRLKLKVPCQYSSGGTNERMHNALPMRMGFFHQDERLWIAASLQLQMVDANTGQPILATKFLNPTRENVVPFAIQAAAASPDGRRLALADSRRIWLWNLESLEPLEPLPTSSPMGTIAAFSKTGTRVLSSDGKDGWIERDPKEDRVVARHGGSGPVSAIAVSQTDDIVFVSTQDRLEWWPDGAEQPTVSRYNGRALEMRFTQDGREIYGISEGGGGFAYDARTGETRGAPPLRRFAQSIYHSPDGHWIATSPENSELRILIDNRYACVPFVPGGTSGSLIFPNGQVVAIGTIGGMIFLWDIQKCDEICRLQCRPRKPLSRQPLFAVSADSKRLAASNEDHEIQVWNTQTGEEVSMLSGHRGRIRSIDFSPDCEQLVSGSDDGSVWLWNLVPDKIH